MPDCIQQQDDDTPEVCGASRAELYPAEPPWARTAGLPDNVTFVDTADAVCGPAFCPAEIGNVLVYLDDNHLTASYSTTMAPLLHDPFVNAITTARSSS